VTNKNGFAAPGFEQVTEAFERNFTDRQDKGAAFAATVDGRLVVDIWGGFADQEAGRPWREETLQLLFSGTKAFVALCLLMLVDRGRLELERPVADYWPEFAAQGKGAILVREVLSHRGRLPGVHDALTEADLLDPVAIASRIAAQPPETDPRAAFVYHALTFGWICAELLRRIDGRSIGRFFADEVARPLELEIWIGLPPELEGRTSTLTLSDNWGNSPTTNPRLVNEDDPLFRSIWANPPLFSIPLAWNKPALHQAEIPAGGGIGTARSIARLYGCLARGGELDGVRLLSERTLELGRRELARGQEPFTDKVMVFGVGFQLQTPQHHLGPPRLAFGHDGAGGGMHGAWPRERAGFSYVMNELRDTDEPDPRNAALLRALYRCLHPHRLPEVRRLVRRK
jgi:CubicO group peptidase (beta-lactamase class C family)